MTVLKFPTAPVPRLATTDDARCAELAATLRTLPEQSVRDRIEASATAELLRAAYGVYWANSRAQASAGASMVAFAMALPFLSDDRINYWLELARYAIDVEMKHWGDPEYAFDPDHAHEVIVDLTDYLDGDEERGEASKDNRDRWADLADSVTSLALAENSRSSIQAA